MNADESSQVYKDRIFTVLNEIDQKVDKVKKKGIVFVGLSRVGKSTAYNWTIKHPLEAKTQEVLKPTVEKKVEVTASSTERKRRKIGESDSLGQSQQPLISTSVTYVPKIIQAETGEVRSGIKSCTLIPNIVDLDEQTSLLDMAGYGDSRDYVGTLGVSYSLRAIFQVLEEVKFIVVVTEAILKNFRLLSDTLNHFFGMFDLQKYPNIEERVFDATSLLITQSVDYTNYYNLINEARQLLDDPQLKNIDNRQLIADFLLYISREVNRFREFKMARLGQSPEECNIIQQFDKKGWKYMNLKITREQVIKNPQDPDIVKLPFQKQFLTMKPIDQQALMTSIDKRLKSYETFSTIFAKLYMQIFVEGSTNDIKLPQSSLFAKINDFLTHNDHYDSEKYIPPDNLLKKEFIKPQKETLFYLLLKFKKIVNFDDAELGISKQLLIPTMDLFRARITQLIQLISVIFCRNINDYKMMLQLRFVLLRGIREFYMLLHVSHERVSSCVYDIRDNFQIIFPPEYKDYWSKFLLSFEIDYDEQRIKFGPKNSSNYMERYIEKRENAFAMEILFKTHEQEIMSLQGRPIDLYFVILRDVKLIHARHQFQNYQYRKCLIYLFEAITLQINFEKRCINRWQEQLSQKYQKEQSKEAFIIIKKLESFINFQKEEMYMNQENIFRMLKSVYIKMNRFQTALIISQKLNWVHSVCEIYEIILAQQRNGNNQAVINNYAEYCMNHGFPEKGRALLHRLIELQRNVQSKKEILKRIRKNTEDPLKPTQAYLKCLNQQFNLNDQRQEELLKIVRQSLKEEEDPNIDRVINMVNHKFDNQNTNQEQIQQQQILVKYLQERDSSQSFLAANGFRVNYNEFAENIPTFVINNALELKKLNIWLIQHLETVSKLTKDSLKGKRLRIDLKQIDQLSISENTIVITLDDQQIKRTFEYAVKLMKAIKKLIYQLIMIVMVIRFTREALIKVDAEIKEHLKVEYQDSITKKEIQAIKAIIKKMPKANNQAIEAEYKKLYKQTKLFGIKLFSIIYYIRQKTCEGLYEEIKQRMPEVSSAQENVAEMDNTRDYY